MNGNGSAKSGIGRRRGASPGSKSPRTSVIVAVASFSLTLFVLIIFGFLNLTSTMVPTEAGGNISNGIAIGAIPPGVSASAGKGDVIEEELSSQFREWGAILRGDLHLVSIQTFGMVSKKKSNKKSSSKDNGALYQGVKASFCKLDWDQYKKDPPSLPMFKFLVSASKCDKKKNLVTLDLATIVQKAREYDKMKEMQQSQRSGYDVHVMPPAGFVFHESRVGSTLVANALTAMNPEGHRVYSESHPINDALKACQGDLSTCDEEQNAQLLQDVVFLMGRTSSSKEKHVFFKVSSVGSKNIPIMQKAFPDVPWIFVYRDPVQTMMSHLDPAKIGNVRAGQTPKAVCLRAKGRPPEDLVQLVADYGADVDEITNEQFCAAHLATLCGSALMGMMESNGKGAAVEYDGLVDKLIESVIPNHFGIDVDEASRQRILDVAKIYSKSKSNTKDWVEDSKAKDIGSTPEIRSASLDFLSELYSELQKYNVK